MDGDRGASYLDRLTAPEFDWRDYDIEPERVKVKPAGDYVDEVLASYRGLTAEEEGAQWPWAKANDKGLRFRPGEVTVYSGINGHRKSMLTSQIAIHLVRQNHGVLLASFEMKPHKTVDRMLRQSAGDRPSEWYAQAWTRWAQGRLWLYDHVGTCPPRQATAVARYAITELQVKHVVIDPLMRIVRDADDYNGQKRFVESLNSLAIETGAHIHLVTHARKGKDVRAGIDKWDVKGAGEITDNADNVVLVNKKDDATDGQPDQWVEVAKQRNGEYEGTMGLYFHGPSLSFGEAPGKRGWGVPLQEGA